MKNSSVNFSSLAASLPPIESPNCVSTIVQRKLPRISLPRNLLSTRSRNVRKIVFLKKIRINAAAAERVKSNQNRKKMIPLTFTHVVNLINECFKDKKDVCVCVCGYTKASVHRGRRLKRWSVSTDVQNIDRMQRIVSGFRNFARSGWPDTSIPYQGIPYVYKNIYHCVRE